MATKNLAAIVAGGVSQDENEKRAIYKSLVAQYYVKPSTGIPESDLSEEVQEKLVKEDGYYPKETVGSAESVRNSFPLLASFLQRKSGGGSGLAKISSLKGNAIVWNELIKNGDFSDGLDNWDKAGGSNVQYSVTDGVLTYTQNGGGDNGVYQRLNEAVNGHKVLVSFEVTAVTGSPYMGIFRGTFTSAGLATQVSAPGRYAVIVTLDLGSSSYFVFGAGRGGVGTGASIKNVSIIDLTLLGIDNLTTAAEVEAWLQQNIGRTGPFAYNAGTVLPFCAEKLVTTGVNQWDEEWELGNITDSGELTPSTSFIRSKNFIPIFPGMEYYFRIPVSDLGSYLGYAYFYDANKSFVGSKTVIPSSTPVLTSPTGAYYMKFVPKSGYGTTYKGNICINLSNPDINGHYFPYEAPKEVALKPLKVKSHNLYDSTTGKAIVKAGKQYYIGGTYTSISQNGTAITVSNHLFTPSQDGEVVVVGGNSTDTIINLSSSFNGNYEPHGVLTILNWGYSTGTARNEIKGSKYIKRLSEVDMGTLAWAYNATYDAFIRALPGAAQNFGAICGRYQYVGTYTNRSDKSVFYIFGNNAGIQDASFGTDAAAFKAAMSGVTIYYELANPIEYELEEPMNYVYHVNKYGTEQWLPANGEEPYTAPCYMDVEYPLSAESLTSDASLKNLLEALKTANKISAYTMTFNPDKGAFDFTIS